MWSHCRANSEQMSRSRPYPGLGSQVKVLEPFQAAPPSLGIDLIAASIYNEYVSGILRSNFNEITTHLVWTVTVT